jgi:hypothetical protein
MYVCVYVCVYVCMYVCVCVYVYVYVCMQPDWARLMDQGVLSHYHVGKFSVHIGE